MKEKESLSSISIQSRTPSKTRQKKPDRDITPTKASKTKAEKATDTTTEERISENKNYQMGKKEKHKFSEADKRKVEAEKCKAEKE